MFQPFQKVKVGFLVKKARSKWQCYDAYCRVCMGLGQCPSSLGQVGLGTWDQADSNFLSEWNEMNMIEIQTSPRCESDPPGFELLLYLSLSQQPVNTDSIRQLLRSVEVTPWLRTIRPQRAMLWWHSSSGLCMFFCLELWEEIERRWTELGSGAQPLLWQCWIWPVAQHLIHLPQMGHFRRGKLCGWGGVAATRDPCCPGRNGWKEVVETDVGSCLTEGRRKKTASSKCLSLAGLFASFCFVQSFWAASLWAINELLLVRPLQVVGIMPCLLTAWGVAHGHRILAGLFGNKDGNLSRRL